MSEITDEALASIYYSLSSCNPTVRGLAERLRRVERESRQWKQSSNRHFGNLLKAAGKCVDCKWYDNAITAEAENTALRERMKRMEEALRVVATFRPHMGTVADMQAVAQAALKEGGEC